MKTVRMQWHQIVEVALLLYLGMNARMVRPDLEDAVVRHDAAPAEIGRFALADGP